MFAEKTDIPEYLYLNGQKVRLIVLFNKKARRMRLRLNHKNQIVVSVPVYLSEQEVLSFIERQYLWLKKQVALMPKSSTISDWLEEHSLISANGERFDTCVRPVDDRLASYQFGTDGSILVFCIPRSSKNIDVDLLKLTRFFARDVLASRIGYHAKRLNLEFERLTVRDQASRWGSCSGKRSISLNWRLILVEPELQDYVILHELAHLTEMNHSERFWRLLDRYDPFRQDHEVSLKKVTRNVMSVGRGHTDR